MIDYSTPTIEQELIRLKAENARLRELLQVHGLDVKKLEASINSFESGYTAGKQTVGYWPTETNEYKTKDQK